MLTAGFAFQYTEKGRPEGLLRGESERLFLTAGGPGYIYKLLGSVCLMLVTFGALRFCGVRVFCKDIFTEKNADERQLDESDMLAVVRRRAL